MKKPLRITFPVITAFFMLLLAPCVFASGGNVSVKAENTAQGIHLEWNECEDAYYYEVYRRTGKKGEKVLLSKVQNTFYEDTEVADGKTYSYSVIPAFADYTVAKESDAVSIYCLSAVRITDSGSQRNGLFIRWKGVKNADGYRVYRKSTEENEWLSVAKLDARADSFIDGEISPAQQYAYCVKAFSGEYESASANEKQLSYISFPKFSSVVNSSKGLLLSWEEVSEAAYYIVYRKTGDGAYKSYALLDRNHTEYEDRSAPAGQLCSYYVCAADARGNRGSFDREITVRCIKKSVITAAVNTAKGIKLYWSKSEGCQGYGIFKKAIGEKEWKLRGIVYGENNLSTVDTKVENRKVYIYTVRAFKDKTLAKYDSDGVALRFYSAPEKLKLTKNDENGCVFSWAEVEGAGSYAVYRKQAEGSWEFMGFTERNYFTDNSAKSKKKYVYAVEVYEGTILKSGLSRISS